MAARLSIALMVVYAMPFAAQTQLLLIFMRVPWSILMLMPVALDLK